MEIDKIKVYRHPFSGYPYKTTWIVEIPKYCHRASYRRIVTYSTWERAVTEAFAIARN